MSLARLSATTPTFGRKPAAAADGCSAAPRLRSAHRGQPERAPVRSVHPGPHGGSPTLTSTQTVEINQALGDLLNPAGITEPMAEHDTCHAAWQAAYHVLRSARTAMVPNDGRSRCSPFDRLGDRSADGAPDVWDSHSRSVCRDRYSCKPLATATTTSRQRWRGNTGIGRSRMAPDRLVFRYRKDCLLRGHTLIPAGQVRHRTQGISTR